MTTQTQDALRKAAECIECSTEFRLGVPAFEQASAAIHAALAAAEPEQQPVATLQVHNSAGECRVQVERLCPELPIGRHSLYASPLREKKEGWQPIETAPTTGREMILLLTPSGWPQVAWSNTWWTSGFSAENRPIGWLPLPPSQENKHG